MEKQGIVKDGVTPPERKPGEKQASKPATPEKLADNPSKRLADGAAAAIRQQKP